MEECVHFYLNLFEQKTPLSIRILKNYNLKIKNFNFINEQQRTLATKTTTKSVFVFDN